MHRKDPENRAHAPHSYFISFLRHFRISAFYRRISEIVRRLLGPSPVIMKKNGAQDCVDSTLIFRIFVTTAKLLSY